MDIKISEGEELSNRVTFSDGDEEESTESTVVGDKSFSISHCFAYAIFLLVFIVMVVLGRTHGERNFEISAEILDSLVPDVDEDPQSIMDIWAYLDFVLPLLLPSGKDDPFGDADPTRAFYVNGNNYLLGGLQLSQQKVAKQDCDVAIIKESFVHGCYPDIDAGEQETDDLEFTTGAGLSSATIQWRDSDQLKGSTWHGLVHNYSGDGYAIELPKNQARASEILSNLKAHNFIDKQTRVVFLDFNLYSPTYNLMTCGRLAFELPATGGCYHFNDVQTWRFQRYHGSRGATLAVFEVLLAAAVIIETASELAKVFKGKWSSSSWRYVDLINLLFFYASAVWVRKNIDWDLLDTGYVSLRYVQYLATAETYLLMVNGFILFVKLFKYMTFSARIRFLFNMIKKATPDLIVFGIVLFTLMCAFGLAGYCAFGGKVYEFRTFGKSFGNLVRFLVTDMNFDDLKTASPTIGAMFYVFWSTVMVIVLANVFIAILCEAYADVQQELSSEKSLIGSLKNTARTAFRSFNFGYLDKNLDGKLDSRELAKGLGVSHAAATTLIQKFDEDGDGKLDPIESVMLKQDSQMNDDR